MRYLGPSGMYTYIGTYTISDNNKLICDVTEIEHTDVSPNENVSFKVVFKIINSNKLQLESISGKDSYNKSIGIIFER